MADSLNSFFSTTLNANNYLGIQTEAHIKLHRGITRTNGISPQLLSTDPSDPSNNVSTPGFTPLWYYQGDGSGNVNNPSAHRVQPGTNRPWYWDTTQDPNYLNSTPYDTIESLSDMQNTFEVFDNRMEDFRFSNIDLQPAQDVTNTRQTFNGVETYPPLRLNQFVETPYENNDPIAYGFEVIIDYDNSPLLNGAVEDFITQFQNLTEVKSRLPILQEFKQQFYKFFKTNSPASTITSNSLQFSQMAQASFNNQTGGQRQNYLAYYLKKITGLEHLVEANTPEKNKSFVEYRKDKIVLSFTEDVSLSLGTLASMYKLLYWSRINGKNIIPENLLRFDCTIIVSELRNYTRVQQVVAGGNPSETVQVLADNLSRYVYDLYECQLFFDKMSHPSEISLEETKVLSDASYDIIMDFKYSSMSFEKWIPTGYAVVNNDRIDPLVINPNDTNSATINTGTGSNSGITFGGNVIPLNVIESYSLQPPVIPPYNPVPGSTASKPSVLAILRANEKKIALNLANAVKKSALNFVQTELNMEFRLLNKALDKVRNSLGIGKMRAPTNVYSAYLGSKNPLVPGGQLSTTIGASNGFFFDAHNELRDFAGDTLANIISAGR